MELEDESPSQVVSRETEPAEETHGQRWQAESNRSDGEALALHEI
jgi:hypothetical protein